MSPTHSDALGDTAVSAYESLRTRILEARVRSTDELGLAVLLRSGMLAWLRAHASVFSEVRAARAEPDPIFVPPDAAPPRAFADMAPPHPAHIGRGRHVRESRHGPRVENLAGAVAVFARDSPIVTRREKANDARARDARCTLDLPGTTAPRAQPILYRQGRIGRVLAMHLCHGLGEREHRHDTALRHDTARPVAMLTTSAGFVVTNAAHRSIRSRRFSSRSERA